MSAAWHISAFGVVSTLVIHPTLAVLTITTSTLTSALQNAMYTLRLVQPNATPTLRHALPQYVCNCITAGSTHFIPEQFKPPLS